MTGDTIKTLAEYIVRLNNANQRLENPEHYQDRPLDTNGVEQDHVETSKPADTKWAHLHLTHQRHGACGLDAPDQLRSTSIETYTARHHI